MTPTTSTHGPESDDGRQDAPGAMDAATEARETIELDAIEARAKAVPHECCQWLDASDLADGHDPLNSRAALEHIAGMDPATTLAVVRELREALAEQLELLREASSEFVDVIQSLLNSAIESEAERDDLRARLAKVEALAERLAAGLALTLHDAHPLYDNTTGWRGGIGGAAITQGCSIIDPAPAEDWMRLCLEDPLRNYLRERPDFDLNAAKAVLADDLRAALGGDR